MVATKLAKMMQRTFKNFDVNDQKDLDRYKKFLQYGAWGKEGCPFICEDPWLSVPDMIKDKIARHFLKLR